MLFDTLEYVDAGGSVQEIALKLNNVGTHGGATVLRYNPRSHAPSTMEIFWVLPPENDVVIPFRSRCKIYANRVSGTGSANSFSGGTILFQGRRTDNQGSASASRVLTSMVISDVWWDLMKITYTIPWRYVSGGTMASPTFSTFNWPDIVLFQAAPGATYTPAAVSGTITTFQQIKALIDFASSYATGADEVQVQMPEDAEFTPAYVNWYPVRSAKVAECLSFCLRPHPGVFTEVDYSTTPPTIHFRDRTNMVTFGLPYKATDADGIVHVASDIKPLYDLVPDTVRLFYKINGEYNGQPIITYSSDNYPSNDNKLLALDFSIDITGSSSNETRYTFISSSFDPTDKTLWRQRVASLRQLSEGGQIPNDGDTGAIAFVDSNPYNSSTHPKGIQVIGEDGTDYSSSYGTAIPYLSDMDVYSWMRLTDGSVPNVVKATVKAFFSYNKISPQGSGSITDQFGEHQHSFRVLLTNASSNTYVLRQTVSTGESIPANLAQRIYTELATLQWQVRHEVFQTAASPTALPWIIKPGKHKINLIGGRAEWETMEALPENVSIQLFRTGDDRLAAQTSVSCGPVNHLEPGYLVQLHNLFWNRNRSGIDAYQRMTGSTASSQVDLSATAPKENSMPSEPVPITTNHAYVSGGAIAGQVKNDAKGIADILAATTPTPIAGETADSIKLMKPREVQMCDDSGNTFYAIVQMTGGYTKP